jgi:hypothetical protein
MMPNKDEEMSGLCIVNVIAINAIAEHLKTTQVGNVLLENLNRNNVRDLPIDEAEQLKSYISKKKKTEKKIKPIVTK